MPILTCPILESVEHVFSPVVNQVTHRILQTLNVESIIGNNIFINADWSTHSATKDKVGNARVGMNVFNVEPQIQMNPTSQKWDVYSFEYTAAYGIGLNARDRSMPTYRDHANGIRTIELVSPVTISMNCELRIQSTPNAFSLPTMIFNQFENGAIPRYHDLHFDYPVPKPIVTVLFQIWKMDRSYGEPAGVSFMDYIRKHSYNQLWTVTKQRDQDEYELTVPCYNLKALAALEYSEDRPSGVMSEKLPIGYSIPFTYSVQFGLPNTLALIYPCVINNQLLPAECLNVDEQSRYNGVVEYARHGLTYETATNYYRFNEYKNLAYFQTPWYDDWVIKSDNTITNAGQEVIVIMHVLVDEVEGLYTAIDLKEDFDDKVHLDEYVKNLIRLEGREAVDLYAPVCISLFREDKALNPSHDFSIDENQVLHFKAADLYQHYRVVISVNVDIYKIRPKWYRLLLRAYGYLPDTLKRGIDQRLDSGDWAGFIADFRYSYRSVNFDWDSLGYFIGVDLLALINNRRAARNQVDYARDDDNYNDYYGVNGKLPWDYDLTQLHLGDIDYLKYSANSNYNGGIWVDVLIDPITGHTYYPGESTEGLEGLERKQIQLSPAVILGGANANYQNTRVNRTTFITRSAHKS